MSFHQYKNDRYIIRWIKDHVDEEELKGKSEEEINEYIYNKLKNYDFSREVVRIVPCKNWLKNYRLLEIVKLLGYFGGKNYFAEIGLDSGCKIYSSSLISDKLRAKIQQLIALMED